MLVEINQRIPAEQIRAYLKTRLGRSRSKVLIGAHECPNTIEKVTYQGAKHLTDEELNQATHLRKGAPLRPAANVQACRQIEYRLQQMGRPFAHCEMLKGGHDSDTEVVFSITEGPKVTIREAQFTGNIFFTAARLKAQLQPSAVLAFLQSRSDSKDLEATDPECGKLANDYRSFGFFDVRVTREFIWAPDDREVIPIFHITEGHRYRSAP